MNKFMFYWTSMCTAFGIYTANSWMVGINVAIGLYVCIALVGEKTTKEEM